MNVKTNNVTAIAREVRQMLEEVPGAVYTVRVNKQWSTRKEEPINAIYVQGMVKLWGDDYSRDAEHKSVIMIQRIMEDVALEHDLAIIPGRFDYTLVQHLD